MQRFFLGLPLLLILFSCRSDGQHSEAATQVSGSEPPAARSYRFDQPSAVHELHKDLKEISGLTVLDDSHLAAVQDEKGNIYVIRTADASVARVVDFGKKGDYEAIERVGDSLWVLDSDGDLYLVDRQDQGARAKSRRVRTGLDRRYDTEGLAYDAAGHRLLLACKEYPGKGYGGKRAIYAFDLNTGQIAGRPTLVIDLEELEGHLRRSSAEALLRQVLRKAFDASDFKPSALAVHPTTGHVWVLSSVLKVLVELGPDGHIVQVSGLPVDMLPQPEGLAFASDGTLYVASEAAGKSNRGVLAVFEERAP